MASSQGVITKRIDLALLEGRELLSGALQRAALVGVGIVLAAGAWFAVAAAIVALVIPDRNLVLRLAAFGLFNAGAAFGLIALGMRGRAQAPARADRDVTGTAGP